MQGYRGGATATPTPPVTVYNPDIFWGNTNRKRPPGISFWLHM